MNVIVTGRHVGVTNAMKGHAQEKAQKMLKYFDGENKVLVTMDIEHVDHIVEMVLHVDGWKSIEAKAESDDMYKSLDLCEAKIEKQLRRHKEKIRDKHPHHLKDSPSVKADGPSESYEDVLRENGLD
jgi:putative sigma-54 modulation protein